MTPPHANPYLSPQFTQTVSRADLEADHDAPVPEVDDNAAAVEALESILKRSFGDFQGSAPALSQEAKRQKKRKTKERSTDDPDATAGSTVDEQPVGGFVFCLSYILF